jgi:glycosyltransferase involved in cell wall biosynthesis
MSMTSIDLYIAFRIESLSVEKFVFRIARYGRMYNSSHMEHSSNPTFPISLIRCSNLMRLDLDSLISDGLRYKDSFEIILVIPEEYRDLASQKEVPFKFIYDDHLGIYHAMNLGLRAATQEYVLYIHDDDSLVENYTKILESCGIVHSTNYDLFEFAVLVDSLVSCNNPMFRSLEGLKRGQMPTSHQGQIWKRNGLLVLGGFKEKLQGFFKLRLKVASDLEIYLQGVAAGLRVFRSDKCLSIVGSGGYSDLHKQRRYLEVSAVVANLSLFPPITFLSLYLQFQIMNVWRSFIKYG